MFGYNHILCPCGFWLQMCILEVVQKKIVLLFRYMVRHPQNCINIDMCFAEVWSSSKSTILLQEVSRLMLTWEKKNSKYVSTCVGKEFSLSVSSVPCAYSRYFELGCKVSQLEPISVKVFALLMFCMMFVPIYRADSKICALRSFPLLSCPFMEVNQADENKNLSYLSIGTHLLLCSM